MEATEDPTVGIAARGRAAGVPWVEYHAQAGDRWRIYGTCNACGACAVGEVNPNVEWTGIPVGQPGACRDRTFAARRDVPMRPDGVRKLPACVLWGHYL